MKRIFGGPVLLLAALVCAGAANAQNAPVASPGGSGPLTNAAPQTQRPLPDKLACIALCKKGLESDLSGDDKIDFNSCASSYFCAGNYPPLAEEKKPFNFENNFEYLFRNKSAEVNG